MLVPFGVGSSKSASCSAQDFVIVPRSPGQVLSIMIVHLQEVRGDRAKQSASATSST